MFFKGDNEKTTVTGRRNLPALPLRDIIVFRKAKEILKEFARVTSRFAIIQLGHNRSEGFVPDDDVPMGGWLSEHDIVALLKDSGFEVLEKRLVLRHDKEGNDVYHFLCKKSD